MAYIQFLSEKLSTKEEIFMGIMRSAYHINNLEAIFFQGNNQEINLSKIYIDDNKRLDENINFLRQDIDAYHKYLKYSDEENPCVVLNIVKGKRLISLFSTDKVRCKRLLFEFAREYLKLHPENYLLIDQNKLYDLKAINTQSDY